MSWSERIPMALGILATLIALPVIGLLMWHFYEQWQDARFYRSHSMLQQMRDVTDLPPLETNQKRTELLLNVLPAGSNRSEAVEVLLARGMTCERPPAHLDQSMLICTAKSPKGSWVVEVKFDENDKVAGGRVYMRKK